MSVTLYPAGGTGMIRNRLKGLTMEDSRTAARALRHARIAFARHVAEKAEERTAKGSARYTRAGRGLRARFREALTIAELLDLSEA